MSRPATERAAAALETERPAWPADLPRPDQPMTEHQLLRLVARLRRYAAEATAGDGRDPSW